MKKKIAIDVDGVMRNLFPRMVEVYNTFFPNDIKSADNIKDYRIVKNFPELANKLGEDGVLDWFFVLNGTKVFYESDIIDDRIPGLIKKIREKYDVTIITWQRSMENKIDTLRWLDKFDIEYDNIIFTKQKGNFHFDYFIDDCVDFIKIADAENVFLIDAPYNREIPIDEKISRENSLVDVLEKLL